MYIRKQKFLDANNESLFLWGARQTGKSTLLKAQYPDSIYFDLLLSDLYGNLLRNPAILRETILAEDPSLLVVIDEIQRIPALGLLYQNLS